MKHLTTFWLSLSLFAFSCHLDKDIDTNPCIAAPRAVFETSPSDCDLPCPVTITNTSDGLLIDSYYWYFDGVLGSTDRNPDPIVYESPGNHTIKLVIEAGECRDSTTVIVAVSNSSSFKRSLGLEASTVYGATERPDGSFHCLYFNGFVQSVIVDLLGMPDNSISLSSASLIVNKTAPYNGGFLLSGFNGNAAKVALVNADQQLVSNYTREFQFGTGSTSSTAQGVIMNTLNEVTATGYRKTAVPYRPGLVRASTTSTTSPLIGSASLDNYGGISIVQKPGGSDYFITANLLSPLGGSDAVLIESSQNGNWNNTENLSPLNFASKIIPLNGGGYAVAGRNSNTGKVYVLGRKADGTSAWQRELPFTAIGDLTNSADGQVVVCATSGNALVIAKFPASNGTTFTWQHPFTETGGGIEGVSIIRTSDGGYLVSGKYDNAGKPEFYLIKTDSAGNTQ